MNKWILFEVAQARSASAFRSKHVRELTESLPDLYFVAFETIGLIHKVCKTKVPCESNPLTLLVNAERFQQLLFKIEFPRSRGVSASWSDMTERVPHKRIKLMGI